jgi:hypothetical protein
VVTNLLAGLMGSRWGIKWTLLSGLSLQLVGISVLYAWQDSWSQPDSKWKAIVFVTFAQVSLGRAWPPADAGSCCFLCCRIGCEPCSFGLLGVRSSQTRQPQHMQPPLIL